MSVGSGGVVMVDHSRGYCLLHLGMSVLMMMKSVPVVGNGIVYVILTHTVSESGR